MRATENNAGGLYSHTDRNELEDEEETQTQRINDSDYASEPMKLDQSERNEDKRDSMLSQSASKSISVSKEAEGTGQDALTAFSQSQSSQKLTIQSNKMDEMSVSEEMTDSDEEQDAKLEDIVEVPQPIEEIEERDAI